MIPKAVWPTLVYADAPAAIRFLVDVVGFEEALVVPAEASGVIEHCQLRWPEGGGIMLGTVDRDDSIFSQRPTGSASTYVVTDDPDAIHARVLEAGATIVQDMREEDYGSRGFSIADPEGNLWSFGTYRGEG